MSGIEVVKSDLQQHPRCPHGPTLLFSRLVDGQPKKFFACSACRDRKDCTFFLWQDEAHKVSPTKTKAWEKESVKFLGGLNHRKAFINLNKVLQVSENRRYYCKNCDVLTVKSESDEKHDKHDLKEDLSDYELQHPSEWLMPLENPKKEAQFLFSKNSVQTIVDVLWNLGYRNIISMGVPRIHEHIITEKPQMSSLLLDFDRRFHNFFGPLQFCWYNSFNHHFFLHDSREVFTDFLNNENVALVMDPPFGGRVEPLAETVNVIMRDYAKFNKGKKLSVFWVFPYFMEPHIRNSLPDFVMLDYKVDYDNHPLFTQDKKGRKYGSPVRIFTNVDPKLIVLPASEGYKFCKQCEKWVAEENQHCKLCNACTSKDGRSYVHCDRCERCIKPSWKHCDSCGKCAQVDHKCGEMQSFAQTCFHCHERGHKKRDCPKVDRAELQKKRKADVTTIKKKSKKIKK